jgi:hypothetical protein
MVVGKALDSNVGYFLWPLKDFDELIGASSESPC